MRQPGQPIRVCGDVRDRLRDFPDHHYRVLYADPPWNTQTWSAKGQGRHAVQHYDVMNLQAIIDLGPEIQRIAGPDSHLFMWTTSAHLQQAFGVMDAWGFRFSSMGFVWVKLKAHPQLFWDKTSFFVGMGKTTRKGSEFCLLGRRGRPKRNSASVREVVFAPVGRHSQKPAEVYDRIEEYSNGPYLELFGRAVPATWSAIGNELEEVGPGTELGTRARTAPAGR